MNLCLLYQSPAAHAPVVLPRWPLPTPPATAARSSPPSSCINQSGGGGGVDPNEALSSLEDGGGAASGASYNSLLAVCISNKAIREGERLRAHLARVGHAPDVFLQNQFLNLYAKCGRMDSARELFDEMRERNVVSWNAVIAGYCSNGRFADAALLFAAMIEAGGVPNKATYLSALRASIGYGDLGHGRQVHARLVKTGLVSHVEIGNSLINAYMKLGKLEESRKVFERITDRDVISWNSAIAANAKLGRDDHHFALFLEMNVEGFAPDEFTFTSLLGSEDAMGVEELHAQILKRALADDAHVGCALLDAYARSGGLPEARLIFRRMPHRSTIAWNSIIAACAENNMVEEGLQLFLDMQQNGALPDAYTICNLLGAATAMESSSGAAGKQVHGLAAKIGLCAEAPVGNMLIAMYSRRGLVSDGRRSFQDIADAGVVSWNSLIQACVDNGMHEEALLTFIEMKDSGIKADDLSFVGALTACDSLVWKQTARAVHGDAVKCGAELDAFVGGALIGVYANCSLLAEAERVFDAIERKDLVAWNSMAAGFAKNGSLDRALELLFLMRGDGLEPDRFTFSGVLSGCADKSALQNGRQVHALVVKSDAPADTIVGNALITMYMRSGCPREASEVFSKMAARNTASWTAIIGGYAQSGCSEEAIELFRQMRASGARAEGRTFTALLTACSYSGKINQARQYFNMMEADYGIVPEVEHYACMVDALGRAGRLEEAESVVNTMPREPSALVWRAMLGACKIHGDLTRGRRAMERVVAAEPGDSAAYVLLSNMYAAAGRWDGVAEVRGLMRQNGVRKEPGKSWVEVEGRVHEFVAGDSLHRRRDEMYAALRRLLPEMKAAGYVPVSL